MITALCTALDAALINVQDGDMQQEQNREQLYSGIKRKQNENQAVACATTATCHRGA